jgi:hypothetical protein
MAYAADGQIGQPTGILQITKDEFNSLNSGKNLQVTKAAEHLYTSYRPGPIGPQPVDCWTLFDQYINANLATFQGLANKYCIPYRSCWCCPNGGLCVAFFVRPTRRCHILTYSTKLAVYEA